MPIDEFQAAPTALPHFLRANLARYWDVGLLVTLCLFLAGMVGWQLVPRPEAILQLQAVSALPGEWVALPAASSAVADGADITAVENSANPRKAPRRNTARHSKKPAIPPIINLNRASATQLQLLPGIGPAMSQRILEHRKLHGPFADPAQIMDVKGIGPKKYEAMKAYIRV